MQLYLLTLSLQSAGIILQARRAVIYSLGDMNSTARSQVLELSKHNIGHLFFQDVFWQMAVAKEIYPAFHLH